jgi:hypothetical protein
MVKIVLLLVLTALASTQAITRYNYKDDTAARLSQLSHAVYSLNTSASVSSSCPNCYAGFIAEQLISGTQEHALIGWDDSVKSVIVAIHSNELQTWLDATQFTTVAFGDASICSGCNVVKRLREAYERLANKGLIQKIQSVVTAHGYCGVSFTGHGVGGAIANYAAFVFGKINDEQEHPLLLYTFGQPRVGDQAYATAHDVEVENDFRVVHDQDITPHLPDSPFVHGGR